MTSIPPCICGKKNTVRRVLCPAHGVIQYTPTTESAAVNVCPIHNNTHYCAYKIQVGKCECVCTCVESAADGGWEEEFEAQWRTKLFRDGLHTREYSNLKSFISDLLRKEREAAYIEGQKHAFGVDRKAVWEEGAKAERERILAALSLFEDTPVSNPHIADATKIAFKAVRAIIQSPPTSQNEGV